MHFIKENSIILIIKFKKLKNKNKKFFGKKNSLK